VPLELINLLLKSGKLYADKRANVVFLLLGKEKQWSEQSFAVQQRSDGVVWQPVQEKIWVASTLKDHTQTKWCFANLP
jgi:hypothetical protein